MSAERVPHLAANESAVARKAASAPTRQVGSDAHPLLRLQRSVGNANVLRMIQAQHDASLQRAAEEEMMQGKHDPLVQRADDDDDDVQARHDAALQRAGEEDEEMQGKHDAALQRVGPEEEMPMQGKHDQATPQVGLEGGAVGGDISGAIDAKRGGGSSLDSGVRGRMEGALGTSLGDVRVHHDSESDALTRQVTSKAFTTGSDVFLRGDQNPSDGNLLAHELTHVVQQRSMSGGGPMSVRPAGDQYEQEADRVADAVMSGPQRKVELEV